jgi:hypothetical protein
MRQEIEQAFDMHAVDIYGLSEVMGPGVANECVGTKDGLHLWEDHFYPEIIDPFTGKVLPDHYYENKEQLLHDLIEAHFVKLEEAVQAADVPSAPRSSACIA